MKHLGKKQLKIVRKKCNPQVFQISLKQPSIILCSKVVCDVLTILFLFEVGCNKTQKVVCDVLRKYTRNLSMTQLQHCTINHIRCLLHMDNVRDWHTIFPTKTLLAIHVALSPILIYILGIRPTIKLQIKTFPMSQSKPPHLDFNVKLILYCRSLHTSYSRCCKHFYLVIIQKVNDPM